MREMLEIAGLVLGLDVPRRADVGRDLFDRLERLCPLTADGKGGEEDRRLRYLGLREAVLERLQGEPREFAGDLIGPAVSEADLRSLVREVRREVERWCRIALFWSQADVIPWYESSSRTLYVDGQAVYQWSGHAEGGSQLLVLKSFQEMEWPAGIDCPLESVIFSSDVCKKLNKAVGKHIWFSVAGEQIRWGSPRRQPRNDG